MFIQPRNKKRESGGFSAVHNPLVDIIGHPDDGIYPLEYEPIVEAAKETNTLLEVNNNSLQTLPVPENTPERI